MEIQVAHLELEFRLPGGNAGPFLVLRDEAEVGAPRNLLSPIPSIALGTGGVQPVG